MMYSIRKATLADLPLLLEFEQALIKVERPMDSTIKEGEVSYYDIADFIQQKDTEVLVAECDSKIVASGYAQIKGDRHYLKHDLQGYLGFMYVDEAYRGQGLNKLLIDDLIQWCKKRAVNEIRLAVYQDNPSAISAYEKVGFKKHLITMRLDASDY